jgi:hypothetical protein
MKILSCIKQMYTPMSCKQLIIKELDEAQRGLLLAQTALDYANSVVLYNNQRINRLTEALKNDCN